MEALRLWAVVEYDGTEFAGFQIQARERTVQGEIERALEAVTGHSTRIVGAGRTDSGVHASGQVIAFSARWHHGIPVLQRALNAVLAADVAIVGVGPARSGFHPRYSATSRTYRYTILSQEWRSPLWRRTAWHVKRPLDVQQMMEASRYLVGTHDFTTFGRPPDGRENGVRTVLGAEWSARANVLTFEIEANAFLYRMVRSVVGTVALVGEGRFPAEEVAEMLQARDRSLVRQVAPALGLCLTKVSYPVSEGVMQ
ncbi:MAG: tRNA pseudouridine(38-40) synthase TruA [Anaerolineae bacterium]|nr:tRNA pseudouridine(38-40) synthase TruA [Anaerolineae bacterium]